MPAVTRLGDKCSGHKCSGGKCPEGKCTGVDCFPPRKSIGGSPNVFANSKKVHRKGDSWDEHCCGKPCHAGVLAAGSGSVYVNGKPIGRVDDPVSCGSTVAEGSEDVFAGG